MYVWIQVGGARPKAGGEYMRAQWRCPNDPAFTSHRIILTRDKHVLNHKTQHTLLS